MTAVLVTGAGGFVGQVLCPTLKENGFVLTEIFRDRQSGGQADCSSRIGKFVGPGTDWSHEVDGIDVVVHLVAKTHGTNTSSSDDLSLFREVNVAASVSLAKQAAKAGVKRFIYISSIKVNGERTSKLPFSVDQRPMPEDSYGRSKHEAEIALREIEKTTGMELVIIRPPLVYGPNVKGNLRALIGLIRKRIPLPLGAVHNRRSLVSVYNLADLIRVCILIPAAAGNTFLVADKDSISTVELVNLIAAGLDRKAILVPIPVRALEFSARLCGKQNAVKKLIGDLRVDISRTEQDLQWRPPFTVAESFEKMFQDMTFTG